MDHGTAFEVVEAGGPWLAGVWVDVALVLAGMAIGLALGWMIGGLRCV